jgi:hypothetical protein
MAQFSCEDVVSGMNFIIILSAVMGGLIGYCLGMGDPVDDEKDNER